MPLKPSLFSNGDTSFVDLISYLSLHTAMSVSCSLGDTCLERADVLAFLYVMFLVFCHFPIRCPESGVVHDCAVPDLWLLSCFLL